MPRAASGKIGIYRGRGHEGISDDMRKLFIWGLGLRVYVGTENGNYYHG